VETVAIDAREFHVYAADWTPERISFSIDDRPVKIVGQSPAYPMQLMLGIYEFREQATASPGDDAYPKELVVDYVRGYRRREDRSTIRR
jgi:beta-glucanase (GH16 family)